LTERNFNPSILEEIFGAAAIAVSILLSPLLRPWYSKWGATSAEGKMLVPGDELALQPMLESTRAISIHASAEAVWPWLVQIGQGRGGLYSYVRLENLVGCDMRNAGRIIPELQNLKPGDKVRLGPEGFPFAIVNKIEPEQALVLRFGDLGEQTSAPVWIWAFYLEPINGKSTRLLLRSRLQCERNFINVLIWRVFTDPIAFVMERKMLQGIKLRVEANE